MSFQKYIHYDTDIEAAIIGICMLEKEAFGRAYGLIEADFFYSNDHAQIFTVIAEMYGQGVPIDIFTVVHWIEQRLIKLNAGNVYFVVAGTTTQVVSSTNLEYHCYLVKEMWRRRELMRIRTSLPADGGFDTAQDIREINSQISRLTSTSVISEWKSMDELMVELIKHQVDMNSGKKTFVTTGFKKIDQRNGGFYEGQMVVIGARPSVGKSALMGKMAIAQATSGKTVGIISLEMNNTEIAGRLASLDTDIDFDTIYRTIAGDEDLHKKFYQRISSNLIHLPIYVSERSKVNMTQIKATAMKLKHKHGCDCLMIDYLQLVDSEEKNSIREQQVSAMSRGIKLMAKEMGIPVIVLCQLNRAITSRTYKDRFPRPSDLRESGAIEQDADVIMFLHRDSVSGFEQDENGESTFNKADLIIPKWRNGAPAHLEIGFDPAKMNFYELNDRVTGLPEGSWKPIGYSEPQRNDD